MIGCPTFLDRNPKYLMTNLFWKNALRICEWQVSLSYQVKLLSSCTPDYSITHCFQEFDQQQQDLVDAASKALSYRQDVIEENLHLTHSLQVTFFIVILSVKTQSQLTFSMVNRCV